MAKKQGGKPAVGVRVTTETREEPIVPDDELDLSAGPEGDEDSDALQELRELGGGDGARYEVRRTSPAEYVGHIGTYSRDEFSMDRLSEEWGGGKYTVRVRGMSGQIIGSKPIQVAGLPRHRSAATPVASAPVVSQQPQVDVGAIITAATAGSQSQINMLAEILKAMLNKPEPVREKAPSTLEVITALAPILKPDKSGDSVAEGFKLFREGIELGKELGGGGGEDASLLGLAGKGLDMVKTMAATAPRRVVPRRPAQQRIAAPPAANPTEGTVPAQEPATPAQPVRVNPKDPPMLKLLNWIKQQTQLLCYQAKRGADPTLYADLFLDNIPEGITLETIYERMSKPDAIKDLAEINPDVLKFPEWMERFRKLVLERIVDADTPDEGEEAGPIEGEVVGEPQGGEGS